MQSVILAEVVRGDRLESVHRGHIVIVEGEGKTVFSAGDPEHVTFIRSSAKPFQAMPLITSGAADRFGFSDAEIAMACASHSGEAVHVEHAAAMLAKAGFTEADLRCGPHLPFNEAEAERMIREGVRPTQLHNNCSGKHAAMLAFARHIDADPANYDSPSHPIQIEILRTMARFAEIKAESIPIAIDGCAAPNFALPLSAMARSFANLINPPDSFDDATRAACRRIVNAFINYPHLIGGTERLDTMLMQAAPGKLISKVGAEGVWLCGVLPNEKHPAGLAIAMKVEDGDDRRARPVAAVAILRSLGILADDQLSELSPMKILNRRGETVGRVESPHILRNN
ncbi:MAG: asparaginase [Pyrinomonadaceae bacterium]